MRLAVFTKNRTNPAYEAARFGAERAAAALGATVAHFVPVLPDDPVEQSALIDDALRDRPDAFVMSPVHPTRVDGALERIAAAGVPITTFVSPAGRVPCVCHVGADDRLLARALSEHLFRHLGGRGRVLVVGGHVDSFTGTERLHGLRDAAAHHPGIELTDPLAGDYSREVARERVTGWLRSHRRPDACWAANDAMALGALDALEESDARDAQGALAAASANGRRHGTGTAVPVVPVVGVNAIPEAVAAIGQGRLLATADFNAMQMACLAAEVAIRALRGEPVPARIELPVQIVDAANHARWLLPYAQRPVISLQQWRQQT